MRTLGSLSYHLLVVALVALVVPAGASAQEPAAAERTDLSSYRADLMNALQSHNGALRAVVTGAVERPEDLVRHARAVADVTEMLVPVWPEGSGGEGTRARVEIWQNWPDFEERILALRAAAAVLLERAEAGDVEGASAALREVGQSCRSCHMEYRSRRN